LDHEIDAFEYINDEDNGSGETLDDVANTLDQINDDNANTNAIVDPVINDTTEYPDNNESNHPENESTDEDVANEQPVNQTDNRIYEPGNDKDNIDEEMDNLYGKRNSRYNMQDRKRRDYSHLHTQSSQLATEQMSMKKGLKMFGEDGVEAVRK